MKVCILGSADDLDPGELEDLGLIVVLTGTVEEVRGAARLLGEEVELVRATGAEEVAP